MLNATQMLVAARPPAFQGQDPPVAEQHQGDGAQDPRRAVEQQAGLNRREAEVEQLVVDVLGVGVRDRDPAAAAALPLAPLAAPAAAIVAAAFSGEPLLAKWTLTFMQGTGRFVVNFFPLFLLGGVFGKLMDDSGAALSMARTITERLGETRAVMAVVLLYGGLSLFFNGVIAIYVAKIFIEVKRRPRTIVREVMGATKIRGDAADG